MSAHDVVVVGSGHNGLIAAAYLAKAGKKVLVLERNHEVGGGTVTAEVPAPGYRHDVHAAMHVLIQANPLVRDDELGLMSQFGLKYCYPDDIFSTVFDDGDCLVTSIDIDKTCASIARVSPRDAEAYRSFCAHSAALLPLVTRGMFVPPMPQRQLRAVLEGSREGQVLLGVMQKSMLDVVDEHFHHDKVKVHLLKCAAELLVPPDKKGTGAFVFNMAGFAHTYPWGIPLGGSGALTNALVRCLECHGAEFRVGADVETVLVGGGKVTGVRLKGGADMVEAAIVIGQIHPWMLGDVVEGLNPDVAKTARATKTSDISLMWMMYALREPPTFTGPQEAARVGVMNFAPASLADYLRAFDDLRRGDLPGSTILATLQHSQWDPSRAPAGAATLTVSAFCPFDLREGGSEAWDAQRSKFHAHLHAQAQSVCANLNSSNIAGVRFDTPADMARYSPTFQRGDLGGIGKSPDQIGGCRPTAELAQYAVPGVKGLYLAGSFMHPAGGVTGGGRATAIRICSDLGIDFAGLCARPR